jgi:hypothetical protein
MICSLFYYIIKLERKKGGFVDKKRNCLMATRLYGKWLNEDIGH